jgi:hypothetical protein
MIPQMQEQFQLIRMYMELRDQLMAGLTDDALGFRPGSGNPTLGELCLQIGEVEFSYIESLRSFECDFAYRHPDVSIAKSVAGLQSWYAELDSSLEAVVDSLSLHDLERRIDRGGGFEVTPSIQLHVYKEALLIFYGRVSVYLKAMGVELGGRWQSWIE